MLALMHLYPTRVAATVILLVLLPVWWLTGVLP
jgi:hypothetical protein